MNNSTINNYLERHEAFLRDLIQKIDIPAHTLKEALSYCMFSGGKRLRPLLVYLSGEIAGAKIECLDYIAAAIELAHCYSLVQDDLPAMDNDDYRRGQLTCHRAYNEATAILVGDGMHSLATEILLTHLPQFLPERKVIQITQELLRASGFSGMVSGQSLDLSELCKNNVTKNQLLSIHGLKTGALFLACIKMALISGTQCDIKSSVLCQFSTCIGIVFQMQDDFHDRYSTSDISGKNRASDEANDKTTFASLLDKQELLDLINQYYQDIYLALEQLGEEAQTLTELTRFLHQRTHRR